MRILSRPVLGGVTPKTPWRGFPLERHAEERLWRVREGIPQLPVRLPPLVRSCLAQSKHLDFGRELGNVQQRISGALELDDGPLVLPDLLIQCPNGIDVGLAIQPVLQVSRTIP